MERYARDLGEFEPLKFKMHPDKFILLMQMLKFAEDNFDGVAMQYRLPAGKSDEAETIVKFLTKVYKTWNKLNN